MTDKEKAKEWVKSNSDESVYSFQGEQLQNAFLAGLKAGRSQWHDLRKNPNDLPDTDRNVWVKRESEIECQIDNYYEDDKGWGIMFREGYCTDDVILWCELPVPPKE